MPEEIQAKPFRKKIADAIAAGGGIVNPGDSVQTVSDKMAALDTNMLPVSEGGRLVGLADEPNPSLEASSHGHDPKTTRISETMNRHIVFCHEDDDCANALHQMEERLFRQRKASEAGIPQLWAMIGSMILHAIGIITGAGRSRVHRPSGDVTVMRDDDAL